MPFTIDLVAGARPNFMKVAPILRALKGSCFSPRLVHTDQHYDAGMSDIFFRQLGIPAPDVHLGAGSGTHAEQTACILIAFERHLVAAQPKSRGVVVVGDVNSTLACTLAAAKLRIPVAHVESGLRSFDRSMPEEINRVVTDSLADLLLVSEPSGLANLRHEGIPSDKCRFVGNVMIDTLIHELAAARALDLKFLKVGARHALVTLHRPSNVDDEERLRKVVTSLESLATKLTIVFPLHPRTRQKLSATRLLSRLNANPAIRLLDPLGYRENLAILSSASVVVTDSGGLQEESSYLGVPCLTMLPNTERPITCTLGTSTLVGDELDSLPTLVDQILAGGYKRGQAIEGWDGRAAERIVTALTEAWR